MLDVVYSKGEMILKTWRGGLEERGCRISADRTLADEIEEWEGLWGRGGAGFDLTGRWRIGFGGTKQKSHAGKTHLFTNVQVL